MLRTPRRKTRKRPAPPKLSQDSLNAETRTNAHYSSSEGYKEMMAILSEIVQEAQPLNDRFSQLDRPPVVSITAQSSQGDEEMRLASQLHVPATSAEVARRMPAPVYYTSLDNSVKITIDDEPQEIASRRFRVPHGRWITRLDAFDNRMVGPLYGCPNSINLSVKDMDCLNSRALRVSYPVTMDSFSGFKFLDDEKCTICRNIMKIYFFYNCDKASFLCEIDDRRKEAIRPHKKNDTLKLSHNACLGSMTTNERNFFFKLMERKLSFRKWWRKKRPLIEILKVLFLIFFMLGVLIALLYVIIKNIIMNKIQVIFWVFTALIEIFTFYKKIRFVTRSVKEYWKACRGNYREFQLLIWQYSSRTEEHV